MSCAFTPARRMNVSRVGVHPEVMAVRIAIEMEPQPVTTHLDDAMVVMMMSKVMQVKFKVQAKGSDDICTHNSLTIHKHAKSL